MPAQTLQDQYVKVGSINTRYWTSGNKGTKVLLLHGAGGCVDYWMQNIGALAQHHCVYAVDMVGSGRSDKPVATYSLTYLAQFIKDFMDALNIKRASLIGPSLGGGVALQFTLMFPEKVSKLVLISCFGLGKELPIGLRLVSRPFLGEFLTRPSRNGIAGMLKLAVHDPTLITDELIDISYQISALPGAHRSLLKLARRNSNIFGVRTQVYRPLVAQLASITAPTLVVWGKQDRLLPVAHADVAIKALPNAHLHVFDPCGHWPPFERPGEFNALVIEFLASNMLETVMEPTRPQSRDNPVG